MTKYEPLASFLASVHEDQRPTGFHELEKILGTKLPGSAYKYSAWWSNNPSNNRMTQVWLDAGWRTVQVDIPGQKLVFERDLIVSSPAAEPVPSDTAASGQSKGQLWWNRVYGCMRGTMTIAEGVDLTQPTGERWKAQED